MHQNFADVAQQHLAAVVRQILVAEGAEDVTVWQPIITKLALEAAHAVLPSALAAFGVSDPRFYIKVASCVSPCLSLGLLLVPQAHVLTCWVLWPVGTAPSCMHPRL